MPDPLKGFLWGVWVSENDVSAGTGEFVVGVVWLKGAVIISISLDPTKAGERIAVPAAIRINAIIRTNEPSNPKIGPLKDKAILPAKGTGIIKLTMTKTMVSVINPIGSVPNFLTVIAFVKMLAIFST